MKELTQVFNGTLLKVEAINDKEFMVDVSGIAKAYGKSIAKWKDTDRFKELAKIRKSTFKGNLTETRQGNGGYTKIHNSMLVSFARFISAEFEVWCDDFIYDYLTADKDAEIKKLKAEKKLATLRDDGTTSVRGIAQRSEYTEKQIRVFAESLGLIKKEIKDTLYWKVQDEKNGLVSADSEFGTPYFDLDRMVGLLAQEYAEDE